MAKRQLVKRANFEEVLPLLHHAGIRFIVIGGGAATIHGSARFTQDVDVVYSRGLDNIGRLIATLTPYSPYPRGAPPGLPFRFDETTIQFGMNFTLDTTLGYVDLLGEVTGCGSYDDLLPHTEIKVSFGLPIRYVTLPYLIHLKRAAGRPKDFEVIAELNLLLEEREKLD